MLAFSAAVTATIPFAIHTFLSHFASKKERIQLTHTPPSTVFTHVLIAIFVPSLSLRTQIHTTHKLLLTTSFFCTAIHHRLRRGLPITRSITDKNKHHHQPPPPLPVTTVVEILPTSTLLRISIDLRKLLVTHPEVVVAEVEEEDVILVLWIIIDVANMNVLLCGTTILPPLTVLLVVVEEVDVGWEVQVPVVNHRHLLGTDV
jgi:hypothetical protein